MARERVSACTCEVCLHTYPEEALAVSRTDDGTLVCDDCWDLAVVACVDCGYTAADIRTCADMEANGHRCRACENQSVSAGGLCDESS